MHYLQLEFPQWGPVIVENIIQRWGSGGGGGFSINSKLGIKEFSLEKCHDLGGFYFNQTMRLIEIFLGGWSTVWFL